MDNSQGQPGSHQVNSVGHGGGEAMSLTTGEVAEIKEVVGRLFKQITQLEVTQKSERAQDRAELKAWAQTNLIQTQLLAQQTATIEILTKELKHSEQFKQQSELHSKSLLLELQSLSGRLGNMPQSSPTVEQLEFKGLKAQVSAMWEGLKVIPQQLERVKLGQTELSGQQSKMETQLLNVEQQTIPSQNKSGIAGWDSKDWRWFAGKAAVTIFLMGGLWVTATNTNKIKSELTAVRQRVDWNKTKLERIEKKSSIKSRR